MSFEKLFKIALISKLMWVSVIVPTDTSLAQQIIYVSFKSDCNGDGNSWNTAFKHLTDALDEALNLASSINPVQIWVQEGFYYPDESCLGDTDSRDDAFVLSNYIGIYGGFGGDEVRLTDRDIENHPTVLSGDIEQNDHLLHGDTANSNHIILETLGSIEKVISGFIIEGGRAFNTTNRSGAGLNSYGNLNLNNTTFRNNKAVSGGAVFIAGQANITDVLFENNESIDTNGAFSLGGGALYLNQGSFNVTNCDFVGNKSRRSGGGLTFRNSEGFINNSSFQNNHAKKGGAIDIILHKDIEIHNCDFISNSVDDYASAISSSKGNLYIENSRFNQNVAGLGHVIESKSILKCTNAPSKTMYP